jgi:ribonuclease-3
VAAVALGFGDAMVPHRVDRVSELPRDWIIAALGHAPRDAALFERALTHPSRGGPDYQRLEFLGDRVLALVIGEWIYDRFPDEDEGQLSRRLNSLVARETCADVGRAIGLKPHLRLGKQARSDGAADSDNVLGDVVEALIGALHIDGGVDAARGFIRSAWESLVEGLTSAPRHPKAALQEWAAAHGHKQPAYSVESRSGPQHAPRFTIAVEIAGVGSARAEAGSKQAAETAAAAALLEQIR